ncbi:MAG TPA: hypothetical protein VK738_12030 [Terriglobales bacterium]|nr:hypothetical protein [Terriglobales bacterium]
MAPILGIAMLTCAWVVGTTLFGQTPAGQTSVLTYHYDNGRTGQNIHETILTPAKVNPARFGRLFSQPVDGYIYAQPLYVPKLEIPEKGLHNVVFVTTEGDSVYAFDADSNTGANTKPLWQASLIDSQHGAAAGATPVNMLAELRCDAIVPMVGSTSTPVIDLSTNTIYVESFSKEGGHFVHRLHALDIQRGTEKAPGPVVITANVPGEGAGGTNGMITFDALHQLNRPGLALVNGTIYIAYSSHCDRSPAHGWIFAYDAATLAQKSVFITTPNGLHGGIWMSGAAPAVDSAGNIFLTTGNGTFDPAQVRTTELSNALLKLTFKNDELNVLDYFIPYDYARLNRHDQDISAGGVLLLPDQPGKHPHMLAVAGKAGTIYLIDRDQMTTDDQHLCGKGCTSDSEIVQEIPQALNSMFGMPAYWNNTLYFCGGGDVLKAFSLRDGLLRTTPGSTSRETYEYPGANISVSANGNMDGIVWTLQTGAYESKGPGVLRAYDANDVSQTLYSSNVIRTRDNPGGAVKFSVPTVVNGKVYVGAAGCLSVYGLLKDAPRSSMNRKKLNRRGR